GCSRSGGPPASWSLARDPPPHAAVARTASTAVPAASERTVRLSPRMAMGAPSITLARFGHPLWRRAQGLARCAISSERGPRRQQRLAVFFSRLHHGSADALGAVSNNAVSCLLSRTASLQPFAVGPSTGSVHVPQRRELAAPPLCDRRPRRARPDVRRRAHRRPRRHGAARRLLRHQP